MNEGPFPGPTPMAGVPEEYAAFTMAELPVARIRSAFFISSAVLSIVSSSMQPMVPAGQPALSAASHTTRAASVMEAFAPG